MKVTNSLYEILTNKKVSSINVSAKLINGIWLNNVNLLNSDNFYSNIFNAENGNVDEPFYCEPKNLDEYIKEISTGNFINYNLITEVYENPNLLIKEAYEKLGKPTQEYDWDKNYTFQNSYWVFSLKFNDGKTINCYLEDELGDFGRPFYLPDNYNFFTDVIELNSNKLYIDGLLVDIKSEKVQENYDNLNIIDLNISFNCVINFLELDLHIDKSQDYWYLERKKYIDDTNENLPF